MPWNDPVLVFGHAVDAVVLSLVVPGCIQQRLPPPFVPLFDVSVTPKNNRFIFDTVHFFPSTQYQLREEEKWMKQMKTKEEEEEKKKKQKHVEKWNTVIKIRICSFSISCPLRFISHRKFSQVNWMCRL